MGDSFFEDVVIDGDPILFFEDSGQVIFVDKVTFGQLVERYFFCVILIQITADHHQVFFLSMDLLKVWAPAFFHKTGKKAGEQFVEAHIPDMVIRTGSPIQSFPQDLKFLDIFRMKIGLSTPFDVFPVNIGYCGTIEMYPFQLPWVRERTFMGIGNPAVDKHHVSCGQLAVIPIIYQFPRAGNNKKEQKRG